MLKCTRAVVESAFEEIDSDDGEYQEEKGTYDDDIEDRRHGLKQRVDDNAKAIVSLDHTQWTKGASSPSHM